MRSKQFRRTVIQEKKSELLWNLCLAKMVWLYIRNFRQRIGKVSDELKVGQRVRVKVNVDKIGAGSSSVKKEDNAPPVLTDLDK